MKPIDLSGLIRGLMVAIGIALTLGKLPTLERWAIKEAFPITPYRTRISETRPSVSTSTKAEQVHSYQK